MTTPDQYMKNLLRLKSQIPKESKRIIISHEIEITSMNIEKIDSHRGNDGKILRNINRKYSGLYQPLTVEIAKIEKPIRSKVLGQPYNWRWNGDFISGFTMKVANDGQSFEIFSTGEGTGLKKDFFDGYTNLYGLTKEDQYELNYNLIYPDLMRFINQYI